MQTCVRCGQLLLPELVRELGEGRRCPFCNADLKVEAKADSKTAAGSPAPQPTRPTSVGQPPARALRGMPRAAPPAARAQPQVSIPPQPPARRPPPPAPSARPAASPAALTLPPAALTLPGMSAARTQTAPAVAVVPAPSPAEPDTAPTVALALARTPEPDTAPKPLPPLTPLPPLPPLSAPLFTLAPSSPLWLATFRRRPWLAAVAVLALTVTIGLLVGRLVVGRRPSPPTGESTAPVTSTVPPPVAALPSVTPLPPAPPVKVAPESRSRIAAADHPVAAKDGGLSAGGSPAAAGHSKAGARSHAAHRTQRQKKRTARPSRGKHTRVVALERAAAPKAAGDESAARASYERGNQRLLTGDTAAAISAYQEAVRSAPSSPSGYRGLGLAYEKEGKIAEAVRAFRQYLKLAPSSGDRDLVARRLRHLLRSGSGPGK